MACFMITPDEILTKAENAYNNKFLPLWVRGNETDFFPLRIPANLSLLKGNMAATIKAVDRLRDKSKEHRGWGYSIHWNQVRSREFGNNPQPDRITIDTLDDLLRLSRQAEHFTATREFINRARKELPGLSAWLVTHVRSLARLAESLKGLMAVTKFFIAHPWPDCFARQIPVNVDTKFVERHQALLRQWLDILLPASAIDVNETKFARRFGLRDGQPHRGIRILDQGLLPELDLPCDELSLPLRSIAKLPVRETTIVIVENQLNLLTLPALKRAIGVRGEGKAVTRLHQLTWLHDNRIIYWGDIDVDGFLILSSLRNLFPHVESILMDRATLEQHSQYVIPGNGTTPSLPSNLNEEESATFLLCSKHNQRLEQEHVLQPFVDSAFATRPGQRISV
ncbi:MAG: hypothetical protein IID46_08245 [Planctomycetes bacterium]|nr:hypothetical protein [Planctomycetota bacterium]